MEEGFAVYCAAQSAELELVEIAGHVATSIACVHIRGDRFTREIGVAGAALTKPPSVVRRKRRNTLAN